MFLSDIPKVIYFMHKAVFFFRQDFICFDNVL